MTSKVSENSPLLNPPLLLLNDGESSVSDKVHAVAEKVQGNADFKLTIGRSILYVIIDGIGGGRQASTGIGAASLLAGIPSVARVANAIIPIGLLITGPLCAGTAIAWTIPDARKNLKLAKEELQEASTPEAKKEALEAVQIAELGVANHGLYLAMGVTQTAAGVTIMCGPEAAHVFHYTPLLMAHAATIATSVTSAGLGAIYVARGTVMLTRAVKNYRLVHDFHNNFQACFNDGQESLEKAIELMENAEKSGSAYLDRRVDASCLTEKDEKNKIVKTYTASGVKDINGTITAYKTTEEKLNYLERVDKGIFTEELKHKVAMVIASVMIIGGILAIISAAIFTGGIALLIIALVSAIFFMSMEYIFIAYDSSSVFNSLRDRLYHKPKWFQKL